MEWLNILFVLPSIVFLLNRQGYSYNRVIDYLIVIASFIIGLSGVLYSYYLESASIYKVGVLLVLVLQYSLIVEGVGYLHRVVFKQDFILFLRSSDEYNKKDKKRKVNFRDFMISLFLLGLLILGALL